MVEYVGLARDRDGLTKAIQEIKAVKEEFWKNLKLLGTSNTLNQSLEAAGKSEDWDVIDREAPRLSSTIQRVVEYIDAL